MINSEFSVCFAITMIVIEIACNRIITRIKTIWNNWDKWSLLSFFATLFGKCIERKKKIERIISQKCTVYNWWILINISDLQPIIWQKPYWNVKLLLRYCCYWCYFCGMMDNWIRSSPIKRIALWLMKHFCSVKNLIGH